MTRNITAQAVSFSLALLVTVSTLVGLQRPGRHGAQRAAAGCRRQGRPGLNQAAGRAIGATRQPQQGACASRCMPLAH